MIIRSVEPGISFKIRVFPMAEPTAEELSFLHNVDEYVADRVWRPLFVEILEVVEPVVAGPGQIDFSAETNADPESWEGPLYEQVVSATRVGWRGFLFMYESGSWFDIGEYLVSVEIVEP